MRRVGLVGFLRESVTVADPEGEVSSDLVGLQILLVQTVCLAWPGVLAVAVVPPPQQVVLVPMVS